MLGSIVFVQRLTEFRLDVLHSVTFVDDHVHPSMSSEVNSLSDDILVSDQTDLPVSLLGILDPLVQLETFLLVSFHDDRADRWGPSLELEHPVGQCRKRDNDEERSLFVLLLDQVRDERDRLDRLS